MKTILIASLVFAIIGVIQAFKSKQVNSSAYLDVGLLLFPDHKEEFTVFYNLYFSDKKKFLSDYNEIVKEAYDDAENLKPVDLVYMFGDSKKLLYMTDWRGEENEHEIEEFIETLLNQKPSWSTTSKLRAGTNE